MKLRFLFIAFLSILLLSRYACAEDLQYNSLEWMIDEAPFIVRGTIVDVTRLPTSPDTPLWAEEDMVVKVSDVLKGDIKAPYINVHRLHKAQISAVDWKIEGADLVFFLKKEEKSHVFYFLYELPSAPINLSHLGENTVLLSNFQVSRDKDEILEIIKYRVAHPAPEMEKTVEKIKKGIHGGGVVLPKNVKAVTIPEGTEAFRAVCATDECALMVPSDLIQKSDKISRGDEDDKVTRSK